MADPSPERPEWLRVLLGVFVVWQLLFVLGGSAVNFLEGQGLLSDEGRPAIRALVGFRHVTTAWTGLTLQQENWGLFSAFPQRSLFPSVEVRDEASSAAPPTLLLRSRLEPADPAHFFAPNVFADRLHNYEAWLSQVFVGWETRAAIADTTQRHEAFAEFGRAWHKPLLAYMQWRVQELPVAPTAGSVILAWRIYEIPPPPGPASVPAALRKEAFRWRPGAEPSAGMLPLEIYDPQLNQYLEVKRER